MTQTEYFQMVIPVSLFLPVVPLLVLYFSQEELSGRVGSRKVLEDILAFVLQDLNL